MIAESVHSVGGEFRRGWPKIATGFTGVALGVTGIFFYTQGIFIRPLQAEFGWTRGEASIASTAFGLSLAFAGPFCGLAVDRFGVRLVASLSILCLAACFWALSLAQGALGYFVGVTVAIAILGSATSAIPHVRLVCNWFARGRGLALGFVMVGTGVSAAIVPPIVARFIAEHGWRAGYEALSVAVLLALPLVVIWGDERVPQRIAETAPELSGLGFRQAAGTPAFWKMGMAFAFAGCAIAGLIPHLAPMMQDAGASPARVGAVMGALGLAVIAGRLVTGFLLDHVFAPFIAAGVLAAAAAGCIGLAWYGTAFGIAGAALIGLAMGSEIDLAGYMSSRYFGLKSYSAIFGFQYGLFSLGAAFGPLAAGLLYDRFGDYRIALDGAAAVLVLGIPVILSLGRYPALDGARAIAPAVADGIAQTR